MANASREIVKYLSSLPADVSQGDILVMFAALYNKTQDPEIRQDRDTRPYRTRVIQKILKGTFGIRGLPVWGASAVRGNLNEDKEHIKRFIDIINSLHATDVEEGWEAAGSWYRDFMASRRKPVALNPKEGMVALLRRLSETRSQGVIQQALCYAVVKVHYEAAGEFTVESKRTWAGDSQSACLGDISVRRKAKLIAVFEVKAHQVDADKLDEVLSAHGKHDYALCIVAENFKAGVMRRHNLFLVRIPDFVDLMVLGASCLLRKPPEETACNVLEVKAHLVDAEKLAETLEPHGKHDYCLCIVAEGFADELEDGTELIPSHQRHRTARNARWGSTAET
jgi:hypothetical protein